MKKEIIEVVDVNYVKQVCKKLKVTNLIDNDFENITEDVNENITKQLDDENRFFTNREILEDIIFYYSKSN